jgi:hypothetical protein
MGDGDVDDVCAITSVNRDDIREGRFGGPSVLLPPFIVRGGA